MEKGAKKFLALVSFASLASGIGATSSVYADVVPPEGTQQQIGNQKKPGGKDNKPVDPNGKIDQGKKDNGPGGTGGGTGNGTGEGTGKGQVDPTKLKDEAEKREKNKLEGRVDDEYDIFYALNSGKDFPAAYSSYFDKVKVGDKDFYKKKGNLEGDMLLNADKALADFTPHYFGKDLGFSKLATAGIAAGAAVVAAGTALAIREYMAGNSDGEDVE